MSCEKDIHTLHAELIHKARDIQFQLKYKNGLTDAEIKLLGGKPNLQFVLESYFSKVGLPVRNETPTGVKNNVNLNFATLNEFIPGTLEVYLGGDKLNGDQSDANRDFVETTNQKGFTIELDASKPYRLNCPPMQDESLEVSYQRRITFNTKGGN